MCLSGHVVQSCMTMNVYMHEHTCECHVGGHVPMRCGHSGERERGGGNVGPVCIKKMFSVSDPAGAAVVGVGG